MSRTSELDRTQHGNRGGDDPIAIEQRGANETRRHDHGVALLCPSGGAQHKCGQRQEAAFAAIVGAHDDEDVFDCYDQRQGPDDQRESTEDRVLAEIAEIDERLAHGIERRGADIAIDDAKRSDRQARACAQLELAPPRGRIEHQRWLGSVCPPKSVHSNRYVVLGRIKVRGGSEYSGVKNP
jgi:hypothetical protein